MTTPDERLADLRAQTDERNRLEAEKAEARKLRRKEAKKRWRENKRKRREETRLLAMSTPVTAPLVATPKAVKRRLVKESLEKLLVETRTKTEDSEVKTRLEAVMMRVYRMAMASEDLDQVLEAAKFIADRLEGKPQQEVTKEEVETQQTFNIVVSPRFESPDKKNPKLLEAGVHVNSV